MTTQLVADVQRQKKAQRERWTGEAPELRRKAADIALFLQEAGEVLIAALRPERGARVLDIASGPGEPALTIAEMNAPDGRVTATDLVPEMLEAAAEQARARGITNVDFRAADAEDLPFPEQAFDRVSCRFGVMFFPDIERALGEMRRVLRPGGRLALLVWGAAERNSLTQALGIVGRYIPQPPPEPGALHQFRFAEAGTLGAAVKAAGFREVSEERRTIDMLSRETPEEMWRMMRDESVEKLPPEQQQQLDREVIAALREQYDGQHLRASAEVIVVSGVR